MLGILGRASAIAAALGIAAVTSGSAAAAEAAVVFVEVRHEGEERWRFAVTVRHADRNADHWADSWRVRTPDGRELGRRVLLHSHVDEQSSTREESIRVPARIRRVVVEAHDKVHGFGGASIQVDLGRAPGPGDRVRSAP